MTVYTRDGTFVTRLTEVGRTAEALERATRWALAEEQPPNLRAAVRAPTGGATRPEGERGGGAADWLARRR